MNKLSFVSTVIIASGLFLPACALASSELTIINHFNKPLSYTIGINPEVMPDVPATFKLEPQQQVATQIVNLGKEAYISVNDDQSHNAFWGVNVVDGQTKVYGYLSKGIAFSWDTQQIVFCTPLDYQQHNNSCI